jgi:hypothetical protein
METLESSAATLEIVVATTRTHLSERVQLVLAFIYKAVQQP